MLARPAATLVLQVPGADVAGVVVEADTYLGSPFKEGTRVAFLTNDYRSVP